DETDPAIPPLYYYIPGPTSPIPPTTSSTVPPSQIDHGVAIASLHDEIATLCTDFISLKDEIATLRTDFHNFMDLAIEQLDRCSYQIH
ncbi:hypothetical protein A2U01_0082911, partial [Trifolium medium]|nr:hypothetical protein [Trifolium medium]